MSQERAAELLGFSEHEHFRFGKIANNSTVLKWFSLWREHFGVAGSCGILFKDGGRSKTDASLREAQNALLVGLIRSTTGFLYHCLDHFCVIVGYHITVPRCNLVQQTALFDIQRSVFTDSKGSVIPMEPAEGDDAYSLEIDSASFRSHRPTSPRQPCSLDTSTDDTQPEHLLDQNLWLFIGDCSRSTAPLRSLTWEFVKLDLTTHGSYVYNARHPERGKLPRSSRSATSPRISAGKLQAACADLKRVSVRKVSPHCILWFSSASK